MAIINNQNIQDIRNGFARYFPEDPKSFKDGPFSSGDFAWTGRTAFTEFVGKEAKVYIDPTTPQPTLIEAAQREFEKRALTPEKAAEGNMPEDLEQKEAAAARREADRKVAIDKANRDVRNVIARQQEIHEEFTKNKPKLTYIKVEDPKLPQADLKGLIENPSIPKIVADLEKSITPSLEGKLTKEEIHLIALDAAYKAVDAATNPQKYLDAARQAAILNAISKDAEVIPKIISNREALENIQTGAREISTFQGLQAMSARTVYSAFDPAVAKALFPSPEDFQINLSESQMAGYNIAFNADGLVKGYTTFLTNNLEFFGKLSGLPVDKFKHELVSRGTFWLESQIAKSFPQATELFAAPETELFLRSLGIGTTTIELDGAFATFFIENPTALPVANFFSSGLGISFEIGGGVVGGAAAASMTAATAETIATTGGIMASEAFLGGAAVAAGGAAAGAAAGSVIPVVGTIIGAVAGIVGPKVINFVKDNLQKYGKYLRMAIGALFGFFLGGAGGAVGGAILGYGLGGGFPAIQAAAAGVASGAGTAASVIWSTFLTGIGTPILVALLGFPVVVALILFIINSGAYITPPAPATFGNISSPYIDVVKTASPPGPFSNNEFPKTITYTVSVKAKKDTLSFVNIKYDCQVISRATLSCPGISTAFPTTGLTIQAGQTETLTYSSTYNQAFQDSAIIDTITVTADTPTVKGATAEGSASVTFGTPPISCPLPGGKPDNPMNYSYNAQADTGHGSTPYWNAMGNPHYRYPLPQLTSCFHPSDCSFYGYSYDVFPHGTTTVYAPSVLGKDLIWNLAGTFTNPGVGYSLEYTDTTGQYTIVMTHVASPSAPKTVSSGSKVATLFNQGSNTHLHIEFQVNGRWQKPENYFCK